jgi:hypothetical protein
MMGSRQYLETTQSRIEQVKNLHEKWRQQTSSQKWPERLAVYIYIFMLIDK